MYNACYSLLFNLITQNCFSYSKTSESKASMVLFLTPLYLQFYHDIQQKTKNNSLPFFILSEQSN